MNNRSLNMFHVKRFIHSDLYWVHGKIKKAEIIIKQCRFATNKSMRNAEEIFNTTSLPAREQVTDWVKIKETIGTTLHGEFLGWWEKPSDKSGFSDQLGIAIKTSDGKVIGISLSDTPYMRGRLSISQPGDSVGVKYEGDKDTGKPQKAKIIKLYNPDAEDRRLAGKTVVANPEHEPVDETTLEDIANTEEKSPF